MHLRRSLRTAFLLLASFPLLPAALPAQTPSLPHGLVSFGACRLATTSYVYGGHTGTAHEHCAGNQRGELLALTDGDSAWREVARGPAMQGTALVAHGNRLLRVGGMQARNSDPAVEDLWSTAEVAAFDVATANWTTLPPLPEPRSSHDAIVHGDRVFVVGGWTLAGTERTWLTTAWSLDLGHPAAGWQPLPTPPFQRRALAVAVHDGALYALGGLDRDGEPATTVDVLDLATGNWRRGPELPGFGFAVAAVAHEGELFVSGRNGPLLRLRADAFEPVGSLMLPRFFHRLLPAGPGELLAIGGAVDAHVALCERVPTAPQHLHTQTWTLPWSHPAKNRQAFVLQRDRLHVFGGNQGKKQHDFQPEHFVGETTTIDLRTLQTTVGPALPTPRQSAVPHVHRGSIELLGGFAHRDGAGRAIADAVALEGGSWRAAVALPAPRTQFGVHEVAGASWLFGGIDYVPERGEDGFVFADEVLRRDAGDGPFVASGHRLPRPRRAFGSAVRDDEVWLVGGMREGFTPVPEVDVFAPATGAWRQGPAPRTPRIAPFLLAIDGALVLAGGSSDGEAQRTLEVLAPDATQWTVVDVPVTPPVLGAVAWRDRVLLVTRAEGAMQLTAMRLPHAAATTCERTKRNAQPAKADG